MAVDRKQLIQAFAKDNPDIAKLQFIRDDPEGFTYKDIGEGGLVNYVYRVLSADKKHSLVLKYGETKLKNIGDEELSLSRQTREYEGLKVMQSYLPYNVVRPYCLDTTHNIIAMEDLSGMTLLSESILKGDFDISLARKLGRIMAELHQSSARQRVSPDIWQKWENVFMDEEYLTNLYNFMRRAFLEDDPLNILTETTRATLKECAAEINKHKLLDQVEALYQQRQCFVHADCHVNAIFVKADNVKLFDFEFSMLTSGSQHLGTLAMAYLMWTYEAAGKPGADWTKLHTEAQAGFKNMIEAYLETHMDLQEATASQAFIGDVAIMCGSTIFLYANLAGIESILKLTDQDKVHLMKMGLHLMLHHREITSLEGLVAATAHYTK